MAQASNQLCMILQTFLLPGLKYLQENKICHGDIKAQNVMLRGKRWVWIDFASAGHVGDEVVKCLYVPPEYAKATEQGKKSKLTIQGDAFALGMMITDILAGFTFWDIIKNTADYSNLEVPIQFPNFPDIDAELDTKVQALLVKNPIKRMSIATFSEANVFKVATSPRKPSEIGNMKIHEAMNRFSDRGKVTSPVKPDSIVATSSPSKITALSMEPVPPSPSISTSPRRESIRPAVESPSRENIRQSPEFQIPIPEPPRRESQKPVVSSPRRESLKPSAGSIKREATNPTGDVVRTNSTKPVPPVLPAFDLTPRNSVQNDRLNSEASTTNINSISPPLDQLYIPAEPTARRASGAFAQRLSKINRANRGSTTLATANNLSSIEDNSSHSEPPVRRESGSGVLSTKKLTRGKRDSSLLNQSSTMQSSLPSIPMVLHEYSIAFQEPLSDNLAPASFENIVPKILMLKESEINDDQQNIAAPEIQVVPEQTQNLSETNVVEVVKYAVKSEFQISKPEIPLAHEEAIFMDESSHSTALKTNMVGSHSSLIESKKTSRAATLKDSTKGSHSSLMGSKSSIRRGLLEGIAPVLKRPTTKKKEMSGNNDSMLSPADLLLQQQRGSIMTTEKPTMTVSESTEFRQSLKEILGLEDKKEKVAIVESISEGNESNLPQTPNAMIEQVNLKTADGLEVSPTNLQNDKENIQGTTASSVVERASIVPSARPSDAQTGNVSQSTPFLNRSTIPGSMADLGSTAVLASKGTPSRIRKAIPPPPPLPTEPRKQSVAGSTPFLGNATPQVFIIVIIEWSKV